MTTPMPPPATDLVWGADVGGTSTRVGVADPAGTVLAVATAGPGNPNTVGAEVSAARLRRTAERALAVADPDSRARVRAAVVGLAGISAVDPEAYAALAAPDRSPAPRVVVDLAVAFHSGTPAPHGVVVLAGTGAGAMEVVDGKVVSRHDGWGWLLGDFGSAQWIGVEAVRHTLRRLEVEHPDGFALEVLAALGLPKGSTVDQVLRHVYAGRPQDLARLAPVVSGSDSATARTILNEAAHFVALAADHATAGDAALPVVLAGSLASAGGPLHDRLAEALRRRKGPTPMSITSATDGVAGACWLALQDAFGPNPSVHRQLVDTVVTATRLRDTGSDTARSAPPGDT